jgi:hypothetical protein
MKINKYRDLCRKLIRQSQHRELTPARKHVLLVLVDYINDEENYTAWPSFDTLAEDAGCHRLTAIKALNTGRRVGVVERVYKGGKYKRGGTSNRYRFPIDPVSGQIVGQKVNLVSHEVLTQYPTGLSPSIPPDTQSSNISPYQSAYGPNSSADASGPSGPRSATQENKDGSGECGAEPPKNEPKWIDIKNAILASWPSFSATLLSNHMQRHGAAKTLERVECAARLGDADIDAVLQAPPMAWETPTLEEVPYTPVLRKLYQDTEPHEQAA